MAVNPPSRSSSMSDADKILGQKEAKHMTAKIFAVVGASRDTDKYGRRLFDALKNAGKDVVPINPNATSIDGVTCLHDVSHLSDPSKTGISIVTPPKETLVVLKEISALKTEPLSIWIQPGATDAECLKYITDMKLSPICIFSQTPLPTPAPATRSALQETDGASDMSDGTDSSDQVPSGCDAIDAPVHPSIMDDHINVDGTVSQSNALLITPTTRGMKRARSPTPTPPATRDVASGPHAAAEEDRRPTKTRKVENNATSSAFPYDPTMLDKMKKFSTCQKFAVVGASNKTKHFGTLIFQAMLKQRKAAIPVNNDPNTKIVDGQNVIPDLAKLQDPSNTAVSIVIPPAQTYTVLQEIVKKSIAVPMIWLQPGAQDQKVIDYIKDVPGLQDRCIWTTSSSSGSTSALKSQDATVKPISDEVPHCRLGPSALDLFSGKLTAWIPAAASVVRAATTEMARQSHGPCLLQRLFQTAHDGLSKAAA